MVSARSGKPRFALSKLRSLEKIRLSQGAATARLGFGLDQSIRTPAASGFNRRRTSFNVDVQELFKSSHNGMRTPIALDRSITNELDYFEWIREVGIVGKTAGTSRSEHMAYRALEGHGLLAPTSRPIPGFDFVYLYRVSGNEGGIEIDMYITAGNIACRIQGEYWHFKSVDEIEAGRVERVILEAQGFRVVDILSQDLVDNDRARFVMGLAIGGVELDAIGRMGTFR